MNIFNFIVRLISCFILSKKERREFRNKHLKKTKYEKMEDRIVERLNYRIGTLLNTFYDVRQIPKATGDLRKIQLANCILLENFASICKENDIEYWLDYGNLLGAYRNQGFIPWDDDIDIGMMREDFQKLQQVISKYDNFKLTEWLHLQTGKNNIQCRVAKFCFNRDDIHLFLDIFPYDWCNCDNLEAFYQKYETDKIAMQRDLRKLNMPQYSFCECQNERDLKIINATFEKYVKKYSSLTEGNAVLYGMENPYNKAKRIFKKETIFPLQKIDFEGKKYSCPNNVEKYLSINFGDYMSIPSDVGIAKHPKYSIDEMAIIEEVVKNIEG